MLAGPGNVITELMCMKDRSTIVCVRDSKVLLVARARSRWSLPGGTIKRSESPLEAARRELEEETALIEAELTYVFHFGGLNKRHHVFCAAIGSEVTAEPRNEISQCHWFSPVKIATLSTSIPTRAIVDLFTRLDNQKGTSPAVAGQYRQVDTDALRVGDDTLI